MYFRQIVDRVDNALAYLLADLAAGEAVLIDPPARQLPLAHALLAERGLHLCWLLHTHRHDAAAAAEFTAFCERMGAMRAGAFDDGGACYRKLGEGDVVAFGDQIVHVLATPGHTPDSISYLWHDRLFCGDALELGGCGPVADDQVDPGVLYDSVTGRLFALPDETLVFPGHDFHGRTVSTVAEERRGNARFSGVSRDAFVADCDVHRRAVARGASVAANPAADGTPLRSGKW